MSATNVASADGGTKRLTFTQAGPPASAPPAAAVRSSVAKAIRTCANRTATAPSSGRVITQARWMGCHGKQDQVIQLQALVNATAAPCGTPASFEVFDADTQKSVDVVKAEVKRGQTVAEWTWKPKGDDLPAQARFSFKVTVKDQVEEVRPIPFEGKGYFIRLQIRCDPNDPTRIDDAVVLESTDASYRRRLGWGAGEKVDNGVILTFTLLDPEKAYNLLIDPGREGPPFYVAKNVQATKAKLKRCMNG